MKPLMLGVSDSLDILAFKWRSMRGVAPKIWLIVVLVFAVGLLFLSATSGSAFRLIMTTPIQNGGTEIQDALTLWVNIFLANNATLAMGGILWALLGTVLIIPLVGYSFSSIVPEGDLASIKVTDNHKIADSLLLQFVSTISFVQIMVLTTVTSIVSIGAPVPGLGIVFSWGLWVLFILLTVLAAWFFELLFRKWGLKSKLLIFATILTVVGLLYLWYPDDFTGMFGIGEAYTRYVQSLSFENIGIFLAGMGALTLAGFGILWLISVTASWTLKVSERPKKRTVNKVFVAKIGLAEKNKISSLTQFLANMVLRQTNIWKPLGLSSIFAVGMAAVFYQFYDVLLTISTLIPIMISLVWSVNIFGIISSGTVWLVSLPYGKQKLLGSIIKIQYVIIGAITMVIIGTVSLVYSPGANAMVMFLLSVVTTSAVITQFSLRKAVYNPYRYRVHIRGESVLPPNKAFSYMIQLFAIGFIMAGLSYSSNAITTTITGEAWLGIAVQLTLTVLICLWVMIRFQNLKHNWVSDPEILQNIVKTVGQ